MNAADYDLVANLLKAESGITLSKDKTYLLDSRLTPVARKHGYAGIDALIGALRGSARAKVLPDIVEAMTTNESFFFRDTKPFDLFKNRVLPELLRTRAQTRTLRIWCAAASTGQEPYSLAMVLHEEAAKLAGWNCEIVATDISTEALAKAQSGLYTQFEVQRGLSIQRLVAYFEKRDAMWQLKPLIRDKVKFRHFNLLQNPRALGTFDVVFCRNVLIYFDQPTKAQVLGQIAGAMRQDGVLFLGGAETVFGISSAFRPMRDQHGIYERVPAGEAGAQTLCA
jgi:chemotaxis protein methyltransferase CheR